MNRKRIRAFTLLLAMLLLTSVLTTAAFAVGKIETDSATSLTVSYVDGEMPIADAHFSIYRVASVDAYVHMALTPEFEPYKNTVAGLSDLEDLSQDQWMTLASTLKGYVLKDGLTPTASGDTDGTGSLTFNGLEPGLYLVIGERVTADDYYTYTCSPFLVFLPGLDPVNNVWDYNVTAVPKFTKEYFPPEVDGQFVTRKVLKIWDDEGYETLRPEEITVQLLCDGKLYDVQLLNGGNNWRYAWDRLPAGHDWEIVELPVDGYVVTVTQSGITFTAENKFIAPVTEDGLPVQKRVTGDKPKQPTVFTFVLTADSVRCPMPEGSTGTVKEITITGAGSADFGTFTFTEPGTYVYTVNEKRGTVQGYVYDEEVYTVTFTVTEEDGELKVTKTVTDSKGDPAAVIEFTNPYKTPGERIPQTGMLWWPVPVLFCAGLVFIMIGAIRRRRYGE